MGVGVLCMAGRPVFESARIVLVCCRCVQINSYERRLVLPLRFFALVRIFVCAASACCYLLCYRLAWCASSVRAEVGVRVRVDAYFVRVVRVVITRERVYGVRVRKNSGLVRVCVCVHASAGC